MPKTLPSEVFRLAPCLTSDELLVLLALADYGDRIFPSQAALAAKTRLSKRTVSRAVASLRTKQVVTTKAWGKALTYHLDLRQSGVGTYATQAQEVRHAGVAPTPDRRRDPNYRTNYQPNQQPADAGSGGWGVPLELRDRIRALDPRGDFVAQEKVCRRMMADHQLTGQDAEAAWRLLVVHWSRTGSDPYATLHRVTESLAGARDVRALVLHKIRGIAA
jgi:hypothetical protein